MRKMMRLCTTGMLALALAACGSSRGTFSDTIDDVTGAFEIVADTADKGSALASLGGGLLVEEGQAICVKSDIESGAVTLRILDGAGEVALEQTYTEPAQDLFGLGLGDFSLSATVDQNKTSGTLTVAVVDEGLFDETGNDLDATLKQMRFWTTADTPEQAAEGAGFEELLLPADGTTLEVGPVSGWALRYEPAHVIAQGSAGAVSLTVHKAVYVGSGDIIGEDVTYAHEWTCDIDGLEVWCAGNVEGQATKTWWVDGNYMYGLLAQGQGSELETFGLSAADVATLVSAIR